MVEPLVTSMAEDASAGPSKTTRESLASARAPTPKRSSKMEAHSRLKKRRIKLLEKKLELYHRQIRRVTEMEVTLDEMKTRSSAYLKEDWLKRRFLHSWEELCALVGVSPEVQMNDHVYVRPYQGTQYPEVNRRVERLLQLGEFPDHYDVCQLVNRCNEKHSLGIKQEEIMQLSKRLFKEIGNILKKQRIKDLVQHLGCHLTDDAPEDPALSDPVLLQQLSANRHLSRQKLEDVCEKFVDKQEREGDSTASSSDNEQEEEEEEGAEYSPRSEMERGITRVGDADRLSGPEHHHCANGMTDNDDIDRDGRHKDENSQAGSGSSTPFYPDIDSSQEDHTSAEESTHSPSNCRRLDVKRELVSKQEDTSGSGSPPAKRTKLETQTEAVEPCLPADIPCKNDLSFSKQQDLVIISSEEDDVTKEVVIVVSD